MEYVLANTKVPTVVDGDAITICAKKDITFRDNFVLTPHVKEMSVLTGIPIPKLQEDTSQLTKLNKLRTLAKRKPIDLEKPNLTNNSHNGMTKETKKSV